MDRPASRAAIIGGAGGFGLELLSGLADRNVAVVGVAAPGQDASGTAIACAWSSVDDVESALSEAARALGGLDAVVDASVPTSAATVGPLIELEETGWATAAEEPLGTCVHVMQASHRMLRARGGRVVVVLPSLAMTGAAGVVPWVTAAEGYRSLVKIAARQWGALGITAIAVAVPAGLLTGAADPLSLDRPGVPGPALGDVPRARVEVATTVAGLLHPDMAHVTGATIAVDGGGWMTP
jgi:3-oxoacyl-[acyl-carrier protein] reductase